MFGFVAHIISSVTTILLPAYLSYKALRSRDLAQIHPWLIYFTILSLALLAESWTYFILSWIPFYSWLRLIFLLYLVLPQTQGAKVLYLDYLEPHIIHHEVQIDRFISQAHASLQRLGLGYVSTLAEFLRDRVLGQARPYQQYQRPQQASYASGGGAGGGSGSYGSYAQDLLSRFAMPQVQTGGGGGAFGSPSSAYASSASGSNIYGVVSGLAGAALASGVGGGGGGGGRSRDVSQEAGPAGIPGSLVQPSSAALSPHDKAAQIAAERERLTGILKSLEREQQNLDLAYGSSPPPPTTTGGAAAGAGAAASYYAQAHGPPTPDTSAASSRSSSGGLKTKSRSEQSFERIDEYGPADSNHNNNSNNNNRSTSGGNWVAGAVTGWLGGGSQAQQQQHQHQHQQQQQRHDYAAGDKGSDAASAISRGWSSAREITEAMLSDKRQVR